MSTNALLPVSQICMLACDMPRGLSSAFISQLCSTSPAETRLGLEAYLDQFQFQELFAFEENANLGEMADSLASYVLEPRPPVPDFNRFAQAAKVSRRLTVELIKLDLKLRWSGRTPVKLEEYVTALPFLLSDNGAASELLRSECLACAVTNGFLEPEKIGERFPELAQQLDYSEIKRVLRKLEQAGNAIQSSRFEMLKKIGSGGMGQVFEAYDREQNMRVALKTMHRSRPGDLYLFKQEFRSLADIVHPNLVRLYELVSDGHSWVYTMELIEGVDFRSWVRRGEGTAPVAFTGTGTGTAMPTMTMGVTGAIENTMPLAPEVTMQANATGVIPKVNFDPSWRPDRLDVDRLRPALRQLVEGIHAVHQRGKLHRDLKPSNVLVQPDGRLVILDFGLVKDLTDKLSSSDFAETGNQIAGSVAYMAPEQAAGKSVTLAEASDWYSVGVMLFEALTGRLPFTGRPMDVLRRKQVEEPPRPSNFAYGIPKDLDDLCVSLLATDPAERPLGVELLALLEITRATTDTASTTADWLETNLPFVGRESYLDRLDECFQSLLKGQTGMVHVYGPSGSGKSVLISRWLRTIKRPRPEYNGKDVVILAGRCYEQESVPYKALDSLIDALSLYLMGLPSDQCKELMPADVQALAAVFPVLKRVASVERSPARLIPDPIELRHVAFDALRDLLFRLGQRQLLVLYIDDLQWGDADSAALLADLLRAAQSPTFLFLVSYRGEYRTTSACLKALPTRETIGAASTRVDELEVLPLTHAESTRLATELLGKGFANFESEAARISAESGGLPFFVYELANQAKLHLSSGSGGRQQTQLDLDEALWNRVQHLPDQSRRIIEAIAVAGHPLSLKSIYQSVAINPAGQPGIEMLRAGHLIRRTGAGLDDTVEPFHDRIRETIMAHLDAEALRSHHRGLANALEHSSAVDAEMIAVHFTAAGDSAKGANFYEKAAEQSIASLAFDRGAEMYRKVLDLRNPSTDEERDLRLKLADALAKAGRGAEAAREYLNASQFAGDDEKFRLQERAAYQFCISGLIEEGREAFRDVLAHLGLKLASSRKAALFSLLRRRFWLWLRGLKFKQRDESQVPRKLLDSIDLLWSVAGGITVIDPIPAAEVQTQNLLLSLEAGEPMRIMRAMAWEASLLSMMGRGKTAEVNKLLGKAEELARQLGTPHAQGMVMMSRCVAEFFLSNPLECRRMGDAAAAIFREKCAGAAWELDQSQAFGYWACYYLGEINELTRRQSGYLKAARERGSRLAESQLTTFAGPFVWLSSDSPEAARNAVGRVSDMWAGIEYQVYHYTLLTARSQIALYEDKCREALDMIANEMRDLDNALLMRVEIVRTYVYHLQARCAFAVADQGQDVNAMMALAASNARALKRIPTEFAQASRHQILGTIAARKGDREKALDELSQSIELFHKGNFHFFARFVSYRRAQVMGGLKGAAEEQAELDWMAQEGIRNPEAMSRVNAAGFAYLKAKS